jgi:murein peptide amidase A
MVKTIAAVVAALAALAGTCPVPAHGVGSNSSCTIDTELRLGARSPDVICLEVALRSLGYGDIHGPDTFFGVSTRRAVLQFQTANGLGVDGIFGPRSNAALTALLTPVVPSRPPAAPVPAAVIESRVIGTSVQGRPIVADRMGTPGGRVVLLIGMIHGDEQQGARITTLLRTMPTPAGVDLWLIDTMNPDGQAANTRENANQVDLNRNFEVGWSYIAKSPDHHQYSGEAPADQPETMAVENFIREIQPSIGIWYHQDANSISTSGANKIVPRTYGQLVGLSPANVPCSQKCTGTAGTFANTTVPGSTNFLVELPGSDQVTAAMIRRHAEAVLAVALL